MRLLPAALLFFCACPGPSDTDGGTDSGSTLVTVTSISPERGPVEGLTQVVINGTGFADGATVVFGTTPATSITVESSRRLTAVTAPAPRPGRASVTVTNPDGRQGTLPDAFLFEGEGTGAIVESVALNPATAKDSTGANPLRLRVRAQVRVAGVTDTVGQGMGVRAQVGFGAEGSGTISTWVDAAYLEDADLFDTYAADVTLPSPMGMDETTWVLGARFSVDAGATWVETDRDGSANGLQDALRPRITVSRPTVDWCKLGGEQIAAPEAYELRVGQPGPIIYGQVYAVGLTDRGDAGVGITGELGIGDAGTDPTTWAWSPATYNHDTGSGSNDEFQAQLPTTVGQPGDKRFAFRFGISGGPWRYCDADGLAMGGFTEAQAGRLTVHDVGAKFISSCKLQYASGSVIGSGDAVMVYGRVKLPGFSEAAGPTAGLVGQVGVGTALDNASTSASWGWRTATFNVDVDGGQDELQATVFPAYTGSRALSFRVSVDDGGWVYCDQNGSDVNGYEVSEQWPLTVGSPSGIEYCVTQWPTSADAGSTVYGRVYAMGLTPGGSTALSAELGAGPKIEDPGASENWTWAPATWNSGCVGCGNNDEYQAALPTGGDHYAWRFSRTDGGSYCHADLDGAGSTTGGFNGETMAGGENLGRVVP